MSSNDQGRYRIAVGSFAIGLGLAITFHFGVSMDPADVYLLLLKAVLQQLDPSKLWVAELLGSAIAIAGAIQIAMFYWAAIQRGKLLSIAVGLTFFAGLFIIFPALQMLAFYLLVSGGGLAALVERFEWNL